jgi:hypothetical protein
MTSLSAVGMSKIRDIATGTTIRSSQVGRLYTDYFSE